MTKDLDAFFKAVFLVAAIGACVGLGINAVSPAHAFCGAMKKDPQPNYATADCK